MKTLSEKLSNRFFNRYKDEREGFIMPKDMKLIDRAKELENWKAEIKFLWIMYKRAKGNISANQASVERFENLIKK